MDQNGNLNYKIKKYDSKLGLEGIKHFNNKIKTTKYSWINFFPLSLYYQFKRFPNIYFLVLSMIGYIPGITSLNPLGLFIPFVAILIVSWIKELAQDIKRYKNDKIINNNEINLVKDKILIKEKWKNIKHGDILELNENDFVPADVIILYNEKNTKETYIETSSLDGEKSLKPKYFIDDINNYFLKNNNLLNNFDFEFNSSKPNSILNNINGFLKFKNEKYSISNKQFIPRGSKIKDLNKVYVLCIIIGHETKIMLNTSKKGNKFSFLENKLNDFIIYIFVFQLILISIASILNYVYNTYFNRFQFQGYTNENKVILALINFLSYLLLLVNLIPLSLIISLEAIRGFQSLFMIGDDELRSGKKIPKFYTINLNEDLGQLNYILSDKTGTLTINKMDWYYLNIGYSLYNFKNIKNLNNKNLEDIKNIKIINNEDFLNTQSDTKIKLKKKFDFFDVLIKYPIKFHSEDKQEFIEIEEEKDLLELNLILLLTCHDCFIKKNNDELIYNGQSPDELAFLNKLKEFNAKLINNYEKEITISLFDNEMILKKLGIIEFDNERKCMSVIVKFKFKNEIKNFLFIKGADSTLINKSNENNIFNAIVNKSIDIFSTKGLRILVLGFKILSDDELEKFENDYEKYNISKNINDIIEWENKINIIGSSAVEDKLVPNLNKTIKNIKNSGIKLWVLTGDKLETAQQIGFSCKLLDTFENLFSIKTEFELKNFFDKENDKIFLFNKQKYSLIIEGSMMNNFFNNKEKLDKFYNLVKDFKSCIFCRITPIQKALIVKLVKSKKNITLAIGDGANDVSMIQKANVGIGLYGKEGRQAANSSDIAISDFTKLDSLIFKHGRLNYIRTSKSMIYFFYKNLVYLLPGYYFGFQSGFSGLNFIWDFYLSTYNTILTTFSVGVRALIEQNILDYKIEYKNNRSLFSNYLDLKNTNKYILLSEYKRKLFPFLYNIGRKNKIFTRNSYFSMVLISIFESILIYFLSIYSFYNYQYYWTTCSICLITIVIINVTVKLTFKTNFLWIGYLYIVFFTSWGIYIIFIFTFEDFGTIIYSYYGFFITNLTFYLVIFLGVFFLISINFTYKILNLHIFPSEVEIVNLFIKNNLNNKNNLKKIIEKNEKHYNFYSKFFIRY